MSERNSQKEKLKELKVQWCPLSKTDTSPLLASRLEIGVDICKNSLRWDEYEAHLKAKSLEDNVPGCGVILQKELDLPEECYFSGLHLSNTEHWGKDDFTGFAIIQDYGQTSIYFSRAEEMFKVRHFVPGMPTQNDWANIWKYFKIYQEQLPVMRDGRKRFLRHDRAICLSLRQYFHFGALELLDQTSALKHACQDMKTPFGAVIQDEHANTISSLRFIDMPDVFTEANYAAKRQERYNIDAFYKFSQKLCEKELQARNTLQKMYMLSLYERIKKSVHILKHSDQEPFSAVQEMLSNALIASEIGMLTGLSASNIRNAMTKFFCYGMFPGYNPEASPEENNRIRMQGIRKCLLLN